MCRLPRIALGLIALAGCADFGVKFSDFDCESPERVAEGHASVSVAADGIVEVSFTVESLSGGAFPGGELSMWPTWLASPPGQTILTDYRCLDVPRRGASSQEIEVYSALPMVFTRLQIPPQSSPLALDCTLVVGAELDCDPHRHGAASDLELDVFLVADTDHGAQYAIDVDPEVDASPPRRGYDPCD